LPDSWSGAQAGPEPDAVTRPEPEPRSARLEHDHVAEARPVDLVAVAAGVADSRERHPRRAGRSRPQLELVIGDVALAEADRAGAADLATTDQNRPAVARGPPRGAPTFP